MERLANPKTTRISLNIKDADGGKWVLPVTLHLNNLGLAIQAEGYGEMTAAEGQGLPIYLEYLDQKLRLLVWADINDEEPTHVIDMEGAREHNRRPQ